MIIIMIITHQYTTLKRYNNFEIRKYNSFTVAQTVMKKKSNNNNNESESESESEIIISPLDVKALAKLARIAVTEEEVLMIVTVIW